MSFNEALHHILNDKLLLYATPFFLLLLAIEYYADKRKKMGLYENKDMVASMAMGVFSLIVEFLPKVVFFMAFFYIHEANVLGLRDVVGRQWWAWILLLFADDFAYYWFHRMNSTQLGKPVFLHQRDAHADFVAILREHLPRLRRGVAHCFTGNRDELLDYLDLGLHVGITGWICDERRGHHLRELVAWCRRTG
jgi:hypothetical protein